MAKVTNRNQSTDNMKPKRIQLRRTKGWRIPPNTVVVARPTKWGNPYKVGDTLPNFFGPNQPLKLLTRKEVVDLFESVTCRAWFRVIRPHRNIEELRGKNLACWCPVGEPCHADVLLELANKP